MLSLLRTAFDVQGGGGGTFQRSGGLEFVCSLSTHQYS